jgi:hypothetical protein
MRQTKLEAFSQKEAHKPFRALGPVTTPEMSRPDSVFFKRICSPL